MRPRGRLYVILDSHGLTVLAGDDLTAQAWLEHWRESSSEVVLFVPEVILTEVKSGIRKKDVLIDRCLKRLAPRGGPDEIYLTSSREIFARAGSLRSDAMFATKKTISPTDAQVVALAEEVARRGNGRVEIFTSDPRDIDALLNQITPRPTNIATTLAS